MRWNGSEPIVLGEVNDNGKPVNTITILPGQTIPPEWVAKMKAAGHVDFIGQDNPFDMAGVQRHYKKKWRNQQ